jgi:hypothetical protein
MNCVISEAFDMARNVRAQVSEICFIHGVPLARSGREQSGIETQPARSAREGFADAFDTYCLNLPGCKLNTHL